MNDLIFEKTFHSTEQSIYPSVVGEIAVDDGILT